MNEIEMISRIKGDLTFSSHVDLVKTPIDFRFEDGSLVMEGVVDRIIVKRMAGIIAASFLGYERVVDRVKLKPATTMADQELIEHIDNAFDSDPALQGVDIEVKAGDGVVFLEGRVNSLVHKRTAEVLTWWIPGTAAVVNHIEVVPPESDSDEELTDAVRVIFDRDMLVRDANIMVKARDAAVTLTGIVKSTAARDAAEEDVWYINGVKGVTNRLEIV